ncbi:DDB1- and CUL4-associated factor 17 isoform X2 [Polyodon spathula]|uniref:DDB1- and CUL4-associated factor 17 isoform X2 n=1 Tax=Polyodon spathula TaxID=7913 RepID=UPI001B7E767C|nr:DDB1- and CUL4-associated factor 17 isoform X2 [Polyodon spathula]
MGPTLHRRKKRSVCRSLSSRSMGMFKNDAGTLYRENLTILRRLVCQDTTTFRKVWTKQSKSPIGVALKPELLYQLPKRSKLEKIEDALLCECPLGETLPRSSDHKPCLLALTADNWLYRLSAKTGTLLESVYLSSQYKFRYLEWDVPQETMVLKSVQKKLEPMTRHAGVLQAALLCLAVFRVLPLTLLGMLEINKTVFGKSVVDATISHGLLIVTHSMGLVRLYSLEHITEQFMLKKLVLGEKSEWNGTTGLVGEAPFGIPLNIQIKDCPPLLFEVSCLENAFQIGGFPYHYIITPNQRRQKGSYHVCSLKDNTLAKNGVQFMECCSLESDWIYFHPDDSGRIVHVGPNQINVLKVKEAQGSQCHVAQDFIIAAKREDTVNAVTVTASGRVVKKRFKQLDDDPDQKTFRIVEYEDELELLAVTQTETEGKALIGLYDNQTGAVIKDIALEESWDVTYSHDMFFERDTIVHIEQEPKNNFNCYVYKMTRDTTDEKEQQ